MRFHLLCLGIVCHACGIGLAQGEESTWQRYSETQPQMGSTVTIVVYARDAETGNAAIKKGFKRIKALNSIFSDYDHESECLRLSRASPMQEPTSVSPEMAELLRASIQISQASNGAFDVTVGPLTTLWRRARRTKTLPPKDALKSATEATGFELLNFDLKKKTVQLARPNMRLDFGGIAKGYVADQTLAAVRASGCASALVNAGGDIAIGEAPPDRMAWRIGVAPLKPKSPPSQILELKSCGVATSGDAWQFLEIDGKRYSHIMDPRTGSAIHRRSSVTVIASNCTKADGLASAVTVLEPTEGMALMEAMGASCFVVESKDGKPVTSKSKGFPEPIND